jgi:class 3 adenylate cyclase
VRIAHPTTSDVLQGPDNQRHGPKPALMPAPASVDLPRRQGWLERLGSAAIDPSDSDELRLRKTLLLLASGLMNIAAFLWLAIYWLMGQKLPSSLPLGYQAASALLLVYYLKTKNFDHYRLAQLGLFLFVPFAIQWSIGSFVSSSGIVLLALLAPIGAMVVYGHRESIPWFAAYTILTVMSGVFDYLLADGQQDAVPMRTIAVFFVLNFGILSTVVFLVLRHFVKQKDIYQRELARQHELVRVEREKSEALLTSILPPHIAERLKNEQSNIADGFADVTVMFADIVSFTRLAEELTPSEVVSFLNDVFTRLDHLSTRYGLDKIKTIGDAYMVVGGLSHSRQFYVDAIADMALRRHFQPLQPVVPHRHRDRARGGGCHRGHAFQLRPLGRYRERRLAHHLGGTRRLHRRGQDHLPTPRFAIRLRGAAQRGLQGQGGTGGLPAHRAQAAGCRRGVLSTSGHSPSTVLQSACTAAHASVNRSLGTRA